MGICYSQKRNAIQKNSDIRQFSQQSIKNFYRMGQIIGKGNFATVQIGYQLQDETIGFKGKCYAIKCIQKTDEQKHLIQRELEILSRLDHPNIIRVYEEYEDLNHSYFVMEYCKGGELLQKILTFGNLPEKSVQTIMRQLFSAVAYLHDNGIIHRDLKPENLMLANADGECDIRIIDFGLSKMEKQYNKQPSSQRSKQRHHTKVGTPIYVAPEVMKGNYSEVSDEWSLGCIMYFLICGQPPFYGNDILDLELKIKQQKIKFPGFVSKDCKDLMKCLLERNPERRITCTQALKHNWMQKDQHYYRILTTMQSDEGNLEIERIVDLLKEYGRSSTFKKETLKILLSQINDHQFYFLRNKFEEIDRDNSGTISQIEFIEYLELYGKHKLVKQIPNIINQLKKDQNSNYISYTDFLASLLNQPIYLTKEKLLSLFRGYDFKSRHYISKHDYQRTMNRKGRIITDLKTEEIFQELDLTLITFDQFSKIMTTKPINKDLKYQISYRQTTGIIAQKIQSCKGDECKFL